MKTKAELPGYMEFQSRIDHVLDVGPRTLLDAAEDTQIHAFGWPIGVVIQRPGLSPKAVDDGIEAEIAPERGSYDFWRLSNDGTYYILKSLFEDRRSEKPVLFIDTRIIRTAEVFLRTARLYERLGVPSDAKMSGFIEYGGLSGRTLAVASPNRMLLPLIRRSSAAKVQRRFDVEIRVALSPDGLKTLVYDVVRRLGEMFDFFAADKQGLVDPTVDAFLQGRII